MTRPRRPSKEIEAAVRVAEDLGWTVELSSGHAWGRLLCPFHSRDGCSISVWSTPRVPEDHARAIIRAVNRYGHCHETRRAMMKTYEFTIIASGDGDDARLTDRLFEAGCRISPISFQKGVLIIEFDRVAKNFAHALTSAMADVRKADVEILHIEPDHLVNLSDIAARAGISRAAVSYYAKGERAETSRHPSRDLQQKALFGTGWTLLGGCTIAARCP